VDTAIALPFPLAHEPEEVRAACPSDEAEWARAAAGGDKSAFGRLVERHKSSVFGVCYRLLGSPGGQGASDEARDAAQEAFVRAYTAISRFDARQPFGAWVLRIARNHCIDLLRRRRPTLALVSESGGDDGPEPGTSAELPDRFAATGESAMQEYEAQRDLDAAVARLPPRYREVIALFHLHHKSYAEIAETLNVPMGTVMTWLHRARKELKAQLSEHFS
jgi:RNA polymerase sigma-70 factor (ECF subfamily)